MADSLTQWLNAAGRYPLLPDSEILRLSKKRDTLTPGSKEYVRVINKITNHNLLLIPKVVRQYINKRLDFTMSSDVVQDLFQQAYIGLRRAAEKYDAKKGFKFSTYANAWIYQAFTRWHNCRDRFIYIPESSMTELMYLKRHGRRSNSKNRSLTDEVIRCADNCLDVGSTDKNVKGMDDFTPISQILSEEHLIISNEPTDENRGRDRLVQLMNDCGIDEKTQTVVLSYGRTGRMSTTASRTKIKEKECRVRYEDAMSCMKKKVAEREEQRAALLRARLSK